ncbi:MAG TPA: DedA family protein [Gammaproteobacteria bacterium]|nr:DedA family protein [Xanthomonadales bacterium]MCB1593679.1 DedA family protein [Xanthomonadales bacterium]HOP21612.1 DedA family protein [Gammaproteobacteria bacterium]HPI95889.1 DedA family protein [Gammaproteobacteria bacterium]HPQ87296.1 DedA family protein [Gammaproteobacteria bacterium]
METSSWLQATLEWVQAHPHATGWMIFIVALGESLLLVGILLPGAALLVGLGTLIGLGVVDFKLAWITASLGAFAGDGISFWIGRHYKKGLLKMWPIYKFPKLIEQGQSFFAKWGALSVFIGRFVGLVRPIIPAIAGVMEMPLRKYLIISTVAAILWSPFYLLPGMLFGNAMGAMSKVAGALSLLVLAFAVVVFVVYWVIHAVYGFLLPRAHTILSKTLVWSQKHPHFGKVTSGLIDPRKPETGSLALMASFILALTVASLFVILNSDAIQNWSQQVSAFMQAFHTDWTQPVLAFFLAITHDLTVFVSSLFVLLWLLRRRRITASKHWGFIVVSGYLLSVLINYFSADNSSWFGIYHLTWFVCVISFWAALISGALPHKMRAWPYTLATLLIALTAFTQLFFMQMGLGVVLISVFSAVFWAAIVAIAYRMRNRKQFLGWPVSAIYFSFQGIVTVLVLIFFSFPTATYQKAIPKITTQQWLESQQEERLDWLSRSKQPFQIRYLGDIDIFTEKFVSEGWQSKQPQAWKDVWTALSSDIEESEEFVVIPSTNNGKIETVILSKKDNDKLTTMHLWKQPAEIIDSSFDVYNGYVRVNKVSEEWGLTFWKSIDQPVDLKFLVETIENSDNLSYKFSNNQYFIRGN